MPRVCRHPDPVQACRACSCWHYDAYIGEDEEPCDWVEPDLCSACAGPGTAARQPAVAPDARSGEASASAQRVHS